MELLKFLLGVPLFTIAALAIYWLHEAPHVCPHATPDCTDERPCGSCRLDHLA